MNKYKKNSGIFKKKNQYLKGCFFEINFHISLLPFCLYQNLQLYQEDLGYERNRKTHYMFLKFILSILKNVITINNIYF